MWQRASASCELGHVRKDEASADPPCAGHSHSRDRAGVVISRSELVGSPRPAPQKATHSALAMTHLLHSVTPPNGLRSGSRCAVEPPLVQLCCRTRRSCREGISNIE